MMFTKKSPRLEGCKDQIDGGKGERQNMVHGRDKKRKSSVVMQIYNKHLEVS